MGDREKARTLLGIILIVVISLGVLLPGLGTVSFWDSDEARYAECARNAIQHSHWIVPYYNGHPRVVKPPFMVWSVALSSLVLNGGEVTEFTARIPSVLAGIGTVVVTYLLAKAMLGSELPAFLAAFILLTSHLFYKQARFSITDMVLTFFVTLGLYCFYKAYTKESRGYVMGMFAALGMATMDKGPAVGLVLPGAIICTYLTLREDLKSVGRFLYPPGLLLYLLITLPWPILLGKYYLVDFLWNNNVKRFAANPGWKTPFWFYVWNFPLHFTPWSAFLPLVIKVIKRAGDKLEEVFFPMSWFAAIFILFSISDTKRSSYILPLYPAAAVIAAWALSKGLEMKDELKAAWALSMGLFAFTLVGYGVCLVFVFVRHIPSYTFVAMAVLGSLIIMAGFFFFISKLSLVKEEMILSCVGALLLALGYTSLYQPLYDRHYRSPKPYCLDIRGTVGDLPLYHYGSIRAHDIFYIQKGVIPSLPPQGQLEGEFFVMARGDKLSKLKRKCPSLRVVKRYGFRGKEVVLLRGERC